MGGIIGFVDGTKEVQHQCECHLLFLSPLPLSFRGKTFSLDTFLSVTENEGLGRFIWLEPITSTFLLSVCAVFNPGSFLLQ